MYAHTQLAAACGGSRGTRRPADSDVSNAAATTSPAPTSTPSSTTPTVPANVSYATAESAFTAHRYADAVPMFDAYTVRHPENVWGHYMLGVSAWKAGQLDKARDAFEAALARDPTHAKSLINMSRVLLEEQRPGDALDRINQVLATDSSSGEAWRVLGRVQAGLGHRDEAIDAYRSAIMLDSTDSWSMNNMGLLLIDGGKYGDATGPLARAVQLDSGQAVFHNNLGIALERSGYVTAAAAAYQDALNADSSYAKAGVSLARVAGRRDAADIQPVDVAALGQQFADQVDGWRAERDSGVATAACGAPATSVSPATGGSGARSQTSVDPAGSPNP